MNQRELMNMNLNGWQLKEAHFLQLSHGLMGFFPARIADLKDGIFVCLEKDLLAEVAKHLPPRECHITSFTALVNLGLNIAFDVQRIGKYPDAKHVRVLLRPEYQHLVAQGDNIFEWTPGLIGRDMSPEEFRQTLDAAIRAT